MRISKIINEIEIFKQLKQLENFSDDDKIEIIALEIIYIFKKHNNNEKLIQKEKVLLGLAYSEFLTDSTDETDLYNAERTRIILLKQLNINGRKLIEKVEE